MAAGKGGVELALILFGIALGKLFAICTGVFYGSWVIVDIPAQ
jgi:hypothetical protein